MISQTQIVISLLTDMDGLQEILEKWGRETIVKMVAVLKSNDSFASGFLINSLSEEFIEDIEGASVVINFAEYGIYVDSGRRPGKWPPIRPIKDWVRNKGLNLSPFAVQRNIFKFGINPRPFLFVFDRELAQLDKNLLNFIDEEIDIVLGVQN